MDPTIPDQSRKRQSSQINEALSNDEGVHDHYNPESLLKAREMDLAAKRRRLRAARACIVCHDRKVKCDVSLKEPGEACSNCSDFGSQCVLYERKKRASKKDKISTDSPSITNTTINSNDSAKHASPAKPNQSSKQYIKPSPFSQLPDTTTAHASPFQKLSTNPLPAPEYVIPNFQPELGYLSSITLDPNTVFKKTFESLIKKEYLISNNSAPFMNEIIDELIQENISLNKTRSYTLDEYDWQMLNLYGCLSLPDEEVCWKYIHNYFEILNPQFPIINKKAFYEEYKDLRNPPSLLLLFSVLYAGARHSDKVDSTNEELFELEKACKILFKRAKLLYDFSLETEPIPIVQSLLCFVWNYENYSMFSKNDYYWTKIAIGYAQQFGFHRNMDDDQYLSLYEKQMYKRLWWCLFIKDKLIGLGFGKPFMISLDDCDVLMLTENDVIDSDMSQLEIQYLINFIKFGELVSNVVHEQTKMNKLMEKGKSILPLLKQCDMLMIKWLSEVPYFLKFRLDDESTQSVLAGILTSQYYTLLILLHKSSIHRGMADEYPSWAISFQAAQMVKLMSDIMVERGLILHISLISHNTLYSSAIIMLYHLMNKDEQIKRISRQFFLSILKVWQLASIKWPTCYPMWFVFNQIYSDEKKRHTLVHSIIDNGQNNRSSNTMIINTNNVMLPKPGKGDESTFDLSAPSIAKIKLNSSTEESAYYSHNEPSSSKLKSLDSLGISFDKLFTNNVFSQSKTLLPKYNINFNSSDDGNHYQQQQPLLHQQLFPQQQQMHAHQFQPHQGSPMNGSDYNQQQQYSQQPNTAPATNEMPVSLWLMNTSWKPDFQTNEYTPPEMTDNNNTNDHNQQQQQQQQNPRVDVYHQSPNQMYNTNPSAHQQFRQYPAYNNHPPPPPSLQQQHPATYDYNGNNLTNQPQQDSQFYQQSQSQAQLTQMAHLLTQLSQGQPPQQPNTKNDPTSTTGQYSNQNQAVPPSSTPTASTTAMTSANNTGTVNSNVGLPSAATFNGGSQLPTLNDNDNSYPSSSANPYKFFKYY